MKKTILFFIAALLMTACVKQGAVDEQPTDKWNGYGKYMKMGEVEHTLWAGQHIKVGKVTYGIDYDSVHFYVKYELPDSLGGWLMSESHMFAGDKDTMPLNKPGRPKVGLFPFSTDDHNPWVNTYTYYVPLGDLPPADNPGFVVAAHCIVHSPEGQTETAWAEGDYTFRDKGGWGWYDVYYFNQPENPFTVIYGITYDDDSLHLYIIDLTNSTSQEIFTEEVNNTSGSYDAAAYDDVSGNVFFTDVVTDELWVNSMDNDAASSYSGTLIGTATSATFYDESFYYVNDDLNTINKVNFDENWNITGIEVLDTIPSTLTVNDIAMSPSGGTMYIIGDVQQEGGTYTTELILWDVNTGTFYTMNIAMDPGAQIAFGSDGQLYAIDQLSTDGATVAYIVDTTSGELTPISDEIVGGEDPFSDITDGRIM